MHCLPETISQLWDLVSKAAKAGGLHSNSAEGSKSKREILWQLDEKYGKTKTKLKNISLPGLFTGTGKM